MRTRAFAALLSLFFAACGSTISGYTLRQPRPDELRKVAATLDPLLVALEFPSLRTVALSRDGKIGFAIIRTDKVNVWSSPANTSPCLYFTLFVTEGALAIPPDHLMATLAHELGHLMLHHEPQSDAPELPVSAEERRAIQAQQLASDRFAIALLKRTKALYHIGSCEAVAQFLQRSIPDRDGPGVPPPRQQVGHRRAG